MNFELTEERRMLRDSLRRFLSDRHDAAARDAAAADPRGINAEIWSGLAGLGVLGALFSEAQGGYGGAGFDIAVVFEELGRAGVTEPVLDTAVLGGGLVAALGTQAQRALVAGVIDGSRHLALAHYEPDSRYDMERVATTATAAGDGDIVLEGAKAVVVNAEAAEHLIVSAREGGAADDPAGISLFVVPAGTAGLSLRGYPLIAGGRAAEVTLEGVRVPASARLGAAGEGFAALRAALARANVALAAETLGAMETAVELTREYLLTRHQFGRPIGSFQALQHRFVDLLIELEQARSAVINAAGHLDAPADERDRQVSAARNLIGRAGRLVAEETIQMHGGIGMTREYALGRFAMRIVMADHRFGDTDWHLERFIELSAA